MKYIVVSQDREVFKAFKEALGTEPMKISSILAALTVLGDKNSTFDFVVIDNELKSTDNLIKLMKKRKTTFYIIGEHFAKPLKIQEIKGVLLSKLELQMDFPQGSLVNGRNIPIEQNQRISELGLEPMDFNVANEEILITVKEKSLFGKETPQPQINKKSVKLIYKNKKLEPKLGSSIKDEKEVRNGNLQELKRGLDITNILGKGIKSVLNSKKAKASEEEKEGKEGKVAKRGILAIPKFKKSMTKIISQQVIGIRRVKGGVGATSIALHLAQAFSSQEIKTCIIDVNFADGGSDLSYYLDLPKIPHWGNFLRNSEDKTSFQDSLIDFEGISIMQVPPAMSLIEDYLTPGVVIKAMNYARKQFAMVIVDLPNAINPIIREVLDSFLTTTVLVTSGHISELNRLEKLNDLDNPIIVMNGVGSKNLNKFKDYLDGIEDFMTVPEDTELYRSLERNKLRSLKTPFGISINNLANKIFEM